MPNFYNRLKAIKFSTASDTAVEIGPSSSATPNFAIDAGGKLKWSSGSAIADTNLYRSAANVLKTDDSFDVASGNTYKIDGSDILSSTSLGSSVVSSSLTSVGSLTGLTAATPNFTGPLTSAGVSTFTNRLDVQQTRETVNDSTASANAFSCDYSIGALFYGTGSLTGNFTVNITNVPTDNGKAMTLSLFVTQGATGRIPTTLNVNGSSVTILWVGGSAPTPTSSSGKIDIFNFTLIRRSSSWTVLANANLNY
jgi:hypothetical protein